LEIRLQLGLFPNANWQSISPITRDKLEILSVRTNQQAVSIFFVEQLHLITAPVVAGRQFIQQIFSDSLNISIQDSQPKKAIAFCISNCLHIESRIK